MRQYNVLTATKNQSEHAKDTNDCAVKAIALVCDITYNEAHKLCKEAGRKKNRGLTEDKILDIILARGFEIEKLSPRRMKMEFFIINDVDRPNEDHVVQKVSPTHAEYLSERLREWGRIEIREESTPIEDFGFDFFVEGETAFFKKQRPSIAKYSDGRPRLWQGDLIFFLDIKEYKGEK